MRLPLLGERKVDLELIEWRSIDLHSIDSTSTLFYPPVPHNCPSLLSYLPLTVEIERS